MTTNNNSSQTLFRFATMRNPQLSDPQNKKKRFIFRPENSADVSIYNVKLPLDKTLSVISKKIDEQEATYDLDIYSEDDLKLFNSGNFYDLAVWVARNKATTTKQEFDTKINAYKTAGNVFPYFSDLTRLWDNLVYQIVTQKDFYTKETIMQFLHLNHILENYDGTEQCFNDIKKAKVVLPKELFKVKGAATAGIESNIAQKTAFNSSAMKSAEAHLNLQDNENLMISFQKTEKAFRKNADAAYKIAYKSYEADTKPAVKQMQKDIVSADNRKLIFETRINYLSQLSVADPEKFYANAELEMELHRLKEDILNISYPETEIPEFVFENKVLEIDPAAIERTLSTEQKNALCRLFNAPSVTTALSGISTFDELYQNITQNNQVLQQTVLNNTFLPTQVSTNIGGVVIPVNNLPNYPLGQIPFSVRTYSRSSTEWSLLFVLSNTNQIISGNYKITVNGTDFTSSSVSNTGSGTTLLFDVPKILVSQTASTGGFVLQGEITLDDGNTYLLNVTLIKDPTDLDRLTKSPHFKGNALLVAKKPEIVEPENPENPEVPTLPSEGIDGLFIPSGFGMKNIGIADYRKVEQSTYCYVEGDVAHIENIMAREYKERATRRLKRSESQTTTSSETEKEKLTDTTSTERHEMQSEISKIMQEAKDFAANAGVVANWKIGDAGFSASANASYATHNSKEESNRQAVTEAKDITARALDRIVTKVKEERIDKILEEYEENNKHGFDNTKGNSHVVGVYRWVDKVVKNQIYNYGKRMMFEFMIPEPAKLHKLGMTSKSSENTIVKPIDPRTADFHKMENSASLDGILGETVLKYWAGKFNIEADEKPKEIIYLGKAFEFASNDHNQAQTKAGMINIAEGYRTIEACASLSCSGPGGNTGWGSTIFISMGNVTRHYPYQHTPERNTGFMTVAEFKDEFPVSVGFTNLHILDLNVSVKCQLTQEAKNAWLQKTFNKIIEAYEIELEKYNQVLAEARALGVQIKGSNPGFYRKIENTILRKNCISYMLDQDPNVELTFGKKRYKTNNGLAETFLNTNIKVDEKLDQYAAFVKFMEQAFEWDIMSYYLYPFYWGEDKSWPDLYQFEDNDPTFRAFMQSGMARVIVTVRPGFEEAVRHYLSTGQIWNGGEVPVIDDELFLSIVDELRSAEGTKEGEPWREKIPTALTILQADSIGLRVEKALPCNCEPGVKFDDQLGEMCGSNFALNNNQVGQSSDKWVEISFNEMDDISFKTIQDYVDAGVYPKTFECLGNTFEIGDELDKSEPSIKLYKRIADEISQIEGVEAYPTGENGITFKVNARLIKNFDFGEVDANPEEKKFAFTTDADTYLKVTSPVVQFGIEKILDKDGQTLTSDEYSNQAPLSKFLV
ncbi:MULTISPECIES: hypothetical protein [unclassified Chryseobacterium]|uniref:hypothetical protein n=1 Tax=unclassified Chryseobacterium TaxID=2593645 RepID=UPI000AD86ED1|nr:MULTISPECIES: hypothetical protein [unclassified Chryseobacterium]